MILKKNSKFFIDLSHLLSTEFKSNFGFKIISKKLGQTPQYGQRNVVFPFISLANRSDQIKPRSDLRCLSPVSSSFSSYCLRSLDSLTPISSFAPARGPLRRSLPVLNRKRTRSGARSHAGFSHESLLLGNSVKVSSPSFPTSSIDSRASRSRSCEFVLSLEIVRFSLIRSV